MRKRAVFPLLILLLALAGCRQGPGHTRAFGTVAGTAAGAAIGAAASPCNRGGGALVGATLGMIGGTLVGDGIAQDQERCRPCPPVTRRTIVRRKVYVIDENGVRRPAEEVVEEVIEEEPSYGYRSR
jgi:phage tail tape-measure protein